MKKLLLVFILCLGINTTLSADDGESQSPMIDFMNSVDWDFFYDSFEISGNVCACKEATNADMPIGVRTRLVEPIIAFSSSNFPMDIVALGTEYSSDIFDKTGRSRSDSQSEKAHESAAFRHYNTLSFPVLAIVGTAFPEGMLCFEKNTEAFGSYISDVDPIYNNDVYAYIKSFVSTAGRWMFSLFVADLACVVDCPAATAGKPLNSLHFCNGCRGNVGAGDHGYAKMGDSLEESEMVAFKALSRLHELGFMLKTSDAAAMFGLGKMESTLCKTHYFSNIIKDQYYVQLAYGLTERFGAYRYHYEGRNQITTNDRHMFWIWRVRDFCLGQTEC